jgi:predicted amidohydrolase
MKKIRVASVQMEPAAGDKQANLAKMEGFLQRTAACSWRPARHRTTW